jgi:hypothetical protein
MTLGSYGRTTEPDVKWFTDEYLDRMDGVDFSTAACSRVRNGESPCLMDGFFTGHGPECLTGVRIQFNGSTMGSHRRIPNQ